MVSIIEGWCLRGTWERGRCQERVVILRGGKVLGEREGKG